jgi:hypothetical protein
MGKCVWKECERGIGRERKGEEWVGQEGGREGGGKSGGADD